MTGERFGRHTDGSVELGDGRRTYYTLLMYLSGGSGQKTKTELSSDKDFSVEAAPPKEWLFFTPVEIVACYMRPVTLRRVSSISFFQT
ncbi:hypothetical protein MKW98_004287 [Papaver atlanticum]|uniref:Uncharacterized protein n=1 Tax=Papaver atlanticum TaxID=357466 RepID=A0AAD4XSK1_9MAGN|nr:hypothetical protein MKW98_004287 [Papaver atlanticum]